MTDSHSGVVPLEKLGHRCTHNLAPTQHHGSGPSNLHSRPPDKRQAAIRGAGQVSCLQVPCGNPPLVDSVEAVHILGGAHGVGDEVGVNGLFTIQGHLDNDAVDVRTLIELLDLVQEVHLADAPLQLQTGGGYPDLLRRLDLHPDVDITVLSTSDLDNDKLG